VRKKEENDMAFRNTGRLFEVYGMVAQRPKSVEASCTSSMPRNQHICLQLIDESRRP
jgi:hypothetical protein